MNQQHNAQQLEAINTLEGQLLVIAGAGSGKTRVITQRIAKLIQLKKARAHEVLAVTFTNKAAKEMIERIKKLTGSDYVFPWVNTFHSICYRLLKKHSLLAGLDPKFMIISDREQKKVLASILEDLKIDKQRYLNLYLDGIETWKNLGLGTEELTTRKHPKLAKISLPVSFEKVFTAYQKLLKENSACDFGDLIVTCIQLLNRNPELKNRYQQQFKYLLVDEYQDVNRAQYNWLRCLAGEEPNLCCVGDEDQAIYGWRGADITRILSFQRDFPNSKIIRLEDNYRSTSEILEAANSLIKHNKFRLGKKLRSTLGNGSKVVVIPVENDRDEAAIVLSLVKQLAAEGCPLQEMAIMVRTTAQMAIFEESLLQARIAYRVLGSLKFYDRQEIRDALAYLQLVHNSQAKLAFKRIANLPRRGLGKIGLAKIELQATAENCSLEAATHSLIQKKRFSKKVSSCLSFFLKNLAEWRQSNSAPNVLLQKLLEDCGYLESLRMSKDPAAPDRIENLNELCNILINFTSIEDFLEHAALVTDLESNNHANQLNLVTLHSAKGLEFETVFLTGWEDGLFPHQRAIEEETRSGIEEERRLAYVGITRAKKNCFISYCRRRFLFGKTIYSTPSRFLSSISCSVTCSISKFFKELPDKQKITSKPT